MSVIPTGLHGAKRRTRQRLYLASIFVCAVLASLLILKFAPAPWVWVWITWVTAPWVAIFCVQGSGQRAILFNLGFTACVPAFAEAYLVTHEYIPSIISTNLYVADDTMGWALAKGTKAHAIKANPTGLLHHPDGLLFDVTYTTDSDGLRVAPPYRKDDLAGTVLFLGCSFTFGEGLDDNATLPYQVGAQSGGRYRTFNFGVGAHGPQQMLAAIEQGMVGQVVDTIPRYAYYIALPGHVWRAAGRVAWGRHAPRYVLDADDSIHRAGNFETRPQLGERLGLNPHVVGQLNKSAIWNMISMGDSRITDDDIRLYFAIVRRSRDLLMAQYPESSFASFCGRIRAARGRNARLMKSFGKALAGWASLSIWWKTLPGYNTDRSGFILNAVDAHPNAMANRLLAQYLLHEIVQ